MNYARSREAEGFGVAMACREGARGVPPPPGLYAMRKGGPRRGVEMGDDCPWTLSEQATARCGTDCCVEGAAGSVFAGAAMKTIGAEGAACCLATLKAVLAMHGTSACPCVEWLSSDVEPSSAMQCTTASAVAPA